MLTSTPPAQAYIAPFRPHPWQVAPLLHKGRVLLLTGSGGGGKSTLAAEKIHAALLKYPNSTGVMLRKTREMTHNSIVLFMQFSVMGNDPRVHHRPGNFRFEYDNGSMLLYGGMKDEQQREAIRSLGARGGVDIAWMEEATQFVEGDFNELSVRMRGTRMPWRQIILTTNPDNPYHWIHRRMILAGGAKVFYSSAWDNPSNPDDYYITLDDLTGVQRDRLRDGKWIQAEGTVYNEFNVDVHLRDCLPDGITFKRVFASVDWGFVNAGVIQVWGVDGDGRMHLLEEVYQTGKLIEWWTERASQLKIQFNITKFVCDPAMPAYIQAFTNANLNAHPAINDIRPGIDLVKSRLKVQPDKFARLYFYRSAFLDPDQSLVKRYKPASVIEEIPGYVWPNGKNGQRPKELPEKADDHGLDTLRYAVQEAETPQGVYFR